MDEILKTILTALIGGGATSIIVILTVIVSYLGWEKYNIQKAHKQSLEKMADILSTKTKENRDDLISVIDRYQEGHITILEAINDIKVLIATIAGKI